ncbi:DUF5367 family protein [uncultured Croceitalea sp.]|uniref:DUF5367 family protein n=1 Tax=uncultured Croceitalea sp. TaxID=1798908 RepID=UPI0033063980
MKHLRAIGIGIIIWIIGVSVYSVSFYIPILENAAQQANTALFIVVMPLVWFGARQYYRKNNKTSGYWVGLTFFLVAATLDALITVPLFIIPNGGSHSEFFTDLGFWIIGLEFLATATMYWCVKLYQRKRIQFLKN